MKKRTVGAIVAALVLAAASTSCGNGKGEEDADVEMDGPDGVDAEEGAEDVPLEDPAADDPEAVDDGMEDAADGVDSVDGDDGDDGEGPPPGGTVETMSGQLPSRVGGIAAATDGTVAYIFGGVTGTPPDSATDAIVRYDPEADEAAALGVTLPNPTFIASADWCGDAAYVFGGYAGSGLTGAVIRFDPAAPTVETMDAVLPSPLGRTAAAWDGSAAILMGGNTGSFMPSGFSDLVAVFDPSGDTVTALTATLPTPRASRIGGIFCGSRTLLFGGWGASGKVDEIVEVSAADGSVTVLEARLPVALDGGALACDGTVAYLFGGESDTATLDLIVRFDTATDEAVLLDVTLPQPLRGHAAVWIGDGAYIFGGNTPSGLSNAILKFTPL